MKFTEEKLEQAFTELLAAGWPCSPRRSATPRSAPSRASLGSLSSDLNCSIFGGNHCLIFGGRGHLELFSSERWRKERR